MSSYRSQNQRNSSNNRNRRRKRRYKVRYDRIIAVGVAFVVLIVILVSCTKSCSDKNDDSSGSSSQLNSQVQDSGASNNSGADSNLSDPNNAQTTNPIQNAVNFSSVSVEYSDINKGDLVLVNKTYEYKFTEELNIVDVISNRNDSYSVSDGDVLLESNVIYNLNNMMEAYATANSNTDLRVFNGYRTIEKQDEIASGNGSDILGGYSDYHTARSFDIGVFPPDASSYYLTNEGIYSWIYSNAANYGFILRYPQEKDNITGVSSRTYTFRYVGIPHAVYMYQNNLSLEEYITNIKSYNKDNTLKITDGIRNYEVYYVTANANNITEVPVPSNQTYSISGNNVDGFIVTVTLS